MQVSVGQSDANIILGHGLAPVFVYVQRAYFITSFPRGFARFPTSSSFCEMGH